MEIFKGFSTVERNHAPFTLTDGELIKRDLLNTFYTKKGERPMRPNYGSIIWDLLMNPQDTASEEQIRNDVERIIDGDPRVSLVNMEILSLDHTLRIELTLRFLPFDNTDFLYLEYTRESKAINLDDQIYIQETTITVRS